MHPLPFKNEFRARPPSQPVKVEDVKMKLSYAFARNFLQNLKAEDVKTKLPYAFARDFRQQIETGRCKNEAFVCFCARLPSKSESGRCENEAFVRDLPQTLKVKYVKTQLSCRFSVTWLWHPFALTFL